MSAHPIQACGVRYHAQEIANSAHALYWAEPGSKFYLHADGVRENFAKLCAAMDALEAAIAPALSDEDFEPDEPNEAEPRGPFDDSGYRRAMIDAGRGHLLGE